MIIYWPGVYTFNGYFSEEDLQMFWVYRYKGFSFTAARTVHTALVLAGQQGCSQADTGHLLLALVQTAQGTAADFLRRKRVTSTALAEHTAAHALGRPRRLHSRDLAPELSKAMEFAVLGAHAASAARAENEHLLCAILEDSSCTASRWLAALGIELPQAARECRQLSGQLVLPAQPRMAASRTGRPSDKYGRDLTRLAQEGRLDPVLCRDAELDRMIEILCRRQKNNPCLLGEPGVGKSALAEALAQRIAAGQITPALRGKRVLALDMASMVAGTKYRGDFEERFKNLLEELYRDRSTILFIDEIHLIAGAGAAEGAIDAASILKPMLARGEIQLIGATTPEEYRKTIQKDSALERRFGRVMVEEPTPAAAETILAGLMPRYERYHGVSIPPEAIHAAVELSVRYLPGRYLPDKAIDLLDEAAAARRIADASGNRRALTPADIARVVSKASGVPAERVGEAERERLANLEQRLAAEVIGQPQAVAAVASAIRRSRTGLRESGRPIGAMLFLGPTGVGKTQLARTLAKCWFGSEKALLRFDNALLYHCAGTLSGVGGALRPGIVHRIDRDTSGLIIAAKNDAAHQYLSAQLADHTLARTYECIVVGSLREDRGTVDAPIARHPTDRKRMAVVAGGREAVTHWEVIARYPGYTHVRCRLETGRTHQIRVHMAYIGHPILGDTVYGAKKEVPGLTGQCLHAVGLRFLHPRTHEVVELFCPLPEEFTRMLQKIRK